MAFGMLAPQNKIRFDGSTNACANATEYQLSQALG